MSDAEPTPKDAGHEATASEPATSGPGTEPETDDSPDASLVPTVVPSSADHGRGDLEEPGDLPPPMAPLPASTVPPRTVAWSSHVVFLVVLVLAGFTLFWPKPDPNRAPMGLLKTAEGELVDLEDYMSDVTLVHFWATWCPPCIAEVPSIRRLTQDFASDGKFSLVMIAVADEVQDATEFLGDTETLFDPDWTMAHDYNTTKLPETHLVVDGKVVQSFIGATDWDNAELRRRLRQILGDAG